MIAEMVIQGIVGLGVFSALAWILSENRARVAWKSVILGFVVQAILAAIILHGPGVRDALLMASHGVNALKESMLAGTSFVFGYIGGAEVPFVVKPQGNTFILMFQAFPMIIVISALSMVLFHWNILPWIVRGGSYIFQKLFNIGGALGICAAAKVFLGQTDAPLLVKPYLGRFSRSELFTVMTAGMATTSVTLMVLYSALLEKTVQQPIVHILTASVISIPAAILFSRIMIPQTEPHTGGDLVVPYKFSNGMEALSQGTFDGMRLMLQIAAMLVVILACVHLVNKVLGSIALGLSLQSIVGYVMAPLAWCMGIPMQETVAAGSLLGTKVVLNEVVGFINLAALPQGALSPVTKLIMMYALCGFGNLSSIAIQIGGIGGMVPERRQEVIGLAGKALIAGTLASCSSGTIVGLLMRLVSMQ